MNVMMILVVVGLLVSAGCAARDEDVSPTSRPAGEGASDWANKSDEQWRRELTPEQYAVLRQKGTERAFSGKYDEQFAAGTYVCGACGLELFESTTKFNSGCGWPAFDSAKGGERVKRTKDYSHGMPRTEVTCARCGSHLGHVFDDAPDQPTGQRYCINSVSLRFVPAGGTTTKPADRR